ncbi:hypothetical protein DFH09DRAFT_881785, partial [Mycena vulgaris]
YTSPVNPSPTYQAFLKFVDALKANDHAGIMACYTDSPDVSVQLLLASMGQPKMDRATYSDFSAKGLANFKSLKWAPAQITLHEVIEAGSTFTVHASSVGESVSGTPWADEYILIIHFTEPIEGGLPKIASVKDFVDSAAVMKFFVDD